LEVTHDRRQRRGHNRLVERGEQHAAHERADDDQDAASAEPRQGAPGGVVRVGKPGALGGRGSGGCHQLLSFLSSVTFAGVTFAMIRRKSLFSGNPAPSAAKASSMTWPSGIPPPLPAQNVRQARTRLTTAAASTPG